MRKARIYTEKEKKQKNKRKEKTMLKKLTANENNLLRKSKILVEIGQGEDFINLAYAQDNIIELSVAIKEKMDIVEVYKKCKRLDIDPYNTLFDTEYIYTIDRFENITHYSIEIFKNILKKYKNKINKLFNEYFKEIEKIKNNYKKVLTI